jgi:hypothetical protein
MTTMIKNQIQNPTSQSTVARKSGRRLMLADGTLGSGFEGGGNGKLISLGGGFGRRLRSCPADSFGRLGSGLGGARGLVSDV